MSHCHTCLLCTATVETRGPYAVPADWSWSGRDAWAVVERHPVCPSHVEMVHWADNFEQQESA